SSVFICGFKLFDPLSALSSTLGTAFPGMYAVSQGPARYHTESAPSSSPSEVPAADLGVPARKDAQSESRDSRSQGNPRPDRRIPDTQEAGKVASSTRAR